MMTIDGVAPYMVKGSSPHRNTTLLVCRHCVFVCDTMLRGGFVAEDGPIICPRCGETVAVMTGERQSSEPGTWTGCTIGEGTPHLARGRAVRPTILDWIRWFFWPHDVVWTWKIRDSDYYRLHKID